MSDWPTDWAGLWAGLALAGASMLACMCCMCINLTSGDAWDGVWTPYLHIIEHEATIVSIHVTPGFNALLIAGELCLFGRFCEVGCWRVGMREFVCVTGMHSLF
jgi:hypothetical protein